MMPYRDMITISVSWRISIPEVTLGEGLLQSDRPAADADAPKPVIRRCKEACPETTIYRGTLLSWLKSMFAVAGMTLLSSLTLSMAHSLRVVISHW